LLGALTLERRMEEPLTRDVGQRLNLEAVV
jgi:hypothetical protein